MSVRLLTLKIIGIPSLRWFDMMVQFILPLGTGAVNGYLPGGQWYWGMVCRTLADLLRPYSAEYPHTRTARLCPRALLTFRQGAVLIRGIVSLPFPN